MDSVFSIFNIELTNHCIMRCIMCPRTRSMTRKSGYIDYRIFAKAIDELSGIPGPLRQDSPVWLHHFGESLLHPEFDRCIRFAAQKNIRTGLSINPVMLEDDIAEKLLDSGLDILYVSLDGHDDDSFMKIRGMKNAYTKSKERLLAFLEKKNTRGIPVKVILSMINFAANSESIDIAGRYWESVPGIDMFLSKSFTSWNGSDAAVNSLVKREEQTPFDMSRVRCTIPWDSMTITWNGDVVPCCFDYDAKYVLGNIADLTLAEIWNGEKMRQLRKEFSDNVVRNSLCVNCERLYMPKELITL
ncbi:MAG TPA: radical SAM/SPASM domain-containing protein [Spirochaetota bacterium]|nr:radical SAM/SPASM domain-containing protein [Spirochaetota bacterium]